MAHHSQNTAPTLNKAEFEMALRRIIVEEHTTDMEEIKRKVKEQQLRKSFKVAYYQDFINSLIEEEKRSRQIPENLERREEELQYREEELQYREEELLRREKELLRKEKIIDEISKLIENMQKVQIDDK